MTKPTLVCVDDESSILQSLERLFKPNFKVEAFDSPATALNFIRSAPEVAIILSDYRMPEMNGVDFLRQARVLKPLSSRAILSGQIDLSQVSDAINHQDIHKFFLKPWENDYLSLQMQEALQTHRTLVEKAHFEQLAITDPVTGLSNHRFFQDQIRLEWRKSEAGASPLSLLLIDVDYFKKFNDRFGHPEGDRLLFRVASAIKDTVAALGFVSRYGGEEFTVILPGFGGLEARELAEKIRERVGQLVQGPNAEDGKISISTGLASYPEHSQSVAELVELADKALYQAKRQGRNQVVVAAL